MDGEDGEDAGDTVGRRERRRRAETCVVRGSMKAVILAGGLGTRLAEETEVRPKPLVTIGERPILWHILKHLRHHGIREFYIALGYRGEAVKRYFLDTLLLQGDLTVELPNGRVEWSRTAAEDWLVHLIDTGSSTMTGGRLRRLQSHLRDGRFLMTYGDGVTDLDVAALLRFHAQHGREATITAVRPPARFGSLELEEDRVREFTEKPQIGEGWVNGGYFVLEPSAIDLIPGDETLWERDPLETLAARGQLMAYRHTGFWHCMDTLRDRRLLEELWQSSRAPWAVWCERES